ncbi:transporter substrate-binding domain-containing protein [Alphaproteobacteria bacterium]|nr:transporter substrate-binding domain-containing protein [Alphaproteobacteria bacterium]
MKIKIRILLLVLLGLSAHSSSALQASSLYTKGIQKIIDRGVLRVAVYEKDVGPFFMTYKGELTGIDIKHAKNIARELGVKVDFNRSATSFNGIVDLVASGEADMAFSKLSYTAERGKKVAYTRPYVLLRKALMINRLRSAKEKSHRPASTLTELLNHPDAEIAVIGGSSYEAFMKKLFPQAKIVGQSSWMPGVWKSVTSRKTKILAASRDDWEISKILRLLPEANLEIQPVFLKGQKDEIRAVVDPTNQDLHRFVENYIRTAKTLTVDGIIEEYSDYLDDISKGFRQQAQE